MLAIDNSETLRRALSYPFMNLASAPNEVEFVQRTFERKNLWQSISGEKWWRIEWPVSTLEPKSFALKWLSFRTSLDSGRLLTNLLTKSLLGNFEILPFSLYASQVPILRSVCISLMRCSSKRPSITEIHFFFFCTRYARLSTCIWLITKSIMSVHRSSVYFAWSETFSLKELEGHEQRVWSLNVEIWTLKAGD